MGETEGGEVVTIAVVTVSVVVVVVVFLCWRHPCMRLVEWLNG